MSLSYYDVAVVGTSLAPTLCAALLARRGFRVLLVGHEQRSTTYTLGPWRLPRAPFTLNSATSPIARRIWAELGLTQNLRHVATELDPSFQVVMARQRLSVRPDEAAWDREIEREFPRVKRPAEEFHAHVKRISRAFDAAVERDLTWPPETFFERRDFARATLGLPFDRTGNAPDTIAELPDLHPFRLAVGLPSRLSEGMDPDHTTALRCARLYASWLQSPQAIAGGWETLQHMLLERLRSHSAVALETTNARSIVVKRGGVTGIRLADSDDEIGCGHVVAGLDVSSLIPLLPERDAFETLFEHLGEPQIRYYRYTLNVVLKSEGVPAGVARDVFVDLSTEPTRHFERQLHLQFERLDAAHHNVCVEALVPRAFVEGDEDELETLRERLLSTLAEVIPFLGEHLCIVDSPHDGHPPTHVHGEPPPPQRGKLVAIHPRLSLTGIKADEWVPIRPGTYGALALGMANVIVNSKLYDENFVRDFTYGFEDFEDAEGVMHQGFKSLVLETYTLERVSAITGVSTDKIARIAGEFATNRPAVAVLPTEPGELSSGNALYTAMAVHALNALVGSIDAKGGVIFQRFPELAEWPAYTLDGDAMKGEAQERLDGAGTQFPLALSAYQNVPERILAGKPYPIEALFLLNANPVYDMPNGGQTLEALNKVPFVVSFASTLDESAAHADLILPASTFLEVWGDDYIEGTGYAGISLRRPVVEPVHDTRDPGDVLLDLAKRLGGSVEAAFPWNSYKELIEKRLSNFDWEKLEANGNWSELVYFNAEPGSPAWGDVVGRDRLNAPKDGRFDFFSRELYAVLGSDSTQACLPHFDIPATLADSTKDAIEYPFLLVTQPLITQSPQWQGIVPTLQESYGLQGDVKWDSWVEIGHKAAEALHLENGDRVWVESPLSRAQATVRVYAGIWPNAVYLPPGLGHHTFVRWGRKSKEYSVVGANPNALTEITSEPLTGLAVSGPARVRIYPV